MKTRYLYHRCSTKSQSARRAYVKAEELGIAAENVFVDFISGTTKALDRPEFAKLYELIDSNSEITVLSSNRIARRASIIFDTIELVHNKGCAFYIDDLGIATNTKSGSIVVAVFASIAEGEFEDTKEAQRQGIEAKKIECGKCGGRPSVPEYVMNAAVDEYLKGERTVSAICTEFGISVSKLYKYMKSRGISRM